MAISKAAAAHQGLPLYWLVISLLGHLNSCLFQPLGQFGRQQDRGDVDAHSRFQRHQRRLPRRQQARYARVYALPLWC